MHWSFPKGLKSSEPIMASLGGKLTLGEWPHCVYLIPEKGDDMLLHLVAAASALIETSGADAKCTALGQYDPAALRQICELERAWSQSVATGDTGAANRVLADDYAGIGSSGKQFTKAEMAAQPPRTAKAVVASDNDYVRVRFFGNMAVNQGQDTIRTHDGHVLHLIWTDTWLKRQGKWQIIQSQDAEIDSPN